jgi:tetratricopeptide (TPR) repeat protein
MAAKIKAKTKSMSRHVKKAVKKVASARKVSVSKGKAAKAVASKSARPHAKPPNGAVRKPVSRVESRDTTKTRETQSREIALQKIRSKEYSNAIHAYESGLKLMHHEEYEKAIKAFRELVAIHSEEPEILERARVLMHACEKKLHERSKTVLKSADDHYNMGVAELNRRQLDSAVQHLQHALKLAPKGDHILYAMAAANALKGNRDEALSFLKQSIHHRPENRFMALRDTDFEALVEDADFKQLVASEK